MNDDLAGGVSGLDDEEVVAAVVSDDVLDGLAADLDTGDDEDEDDFGGALVGEEEDERGWGMD